jgi:hypothetical protein
MTLRSWVVLAVMACLPACDCGKPGGGNRTDCGAFAPVLDAYCEAIERCPNVYPMATRSRAECIDTLCYFFTCRIKDEKQGRVHNYSVVQEIPITDEARVSACAAYVKAATCEGLSSVTSSNDSNDSSGSTAQTPKTPCDGVFSTSSSSSGGLPVGETCTDGDCASGLYCSVETLVRDAGALRCRTCTSLPTVGEACFTRTNGCAKGLVCDQAVFPNLCQLPLGDGVTCSLSNTCSSLFCNPKLKVCDPGGKSGDACATSADCRTGFCNAGLACEERHKNGTACTSGAECLHGKCDAATQVCGLPTGSVCQRDQHTACATTYCDAATLKCAEQAAVGEKCGSAQACASNYCSSGYCRSYCSDDAACGAGRYCNHSNNQCYDYALDGAKCGDSDECLSGYCNASEKCGKRPGVGDACSARYECYPAGYCSSGVCLKGKSPGADCDAVDECLAPYICREKKCQLMNLVCRAGAVGEGCAFYRVCDEGGYCDVLAGFVCKPKKRQGEGCDLPEHCGAGLTCVMSTTGGAMACAPRAAVGEPCTSAAGCQEGLFCAGIGTATATCSAGPAGKPCKYGTPCPTGFYCSTRDFCAANRTLGQSCSSTYEPCSAELYCDSSKGCQPKKQEGETCSYQALCTDDLQCDHSANRCVKDAALGEACSSQRECAPSLFCKYVDGKYGCVTKQGGGAPCGGDGECLSGRCYSSTMCLATDVCVAGP